MKRLAFILVVAGLALAGCGDKKKDPAAGTTAPANPTAGEAGDGPAAAAAAETTELQPPLEAPRKLLAVGAEVPAFTMQAHTGETIDPAALRGQKLVIYFYPKDETPG